MHRRSFLGAGVGVAALLAGCYEGGGDGDGGPDDTATPTSTGTPTGTQTPLSLLIADVSEGDDGVLVATVEVTNQSDAEATGTVELTARAGDDSQTVTREVTVPARESVTIELTFSELTREAFADDGGFPKASVSG